MAIPIVGVAKAGWTLDQLKDRARDSLINHGGIDEAAFAKLSNLLRYVDGDYRDPQTFVRLRETLADCCRPLHYLAIPPAMFQAVTEGLANAGLCASARVRTPQFGPAESASRLHRALLWTNALAVRWISSGRSS